MDLLGYLCIGFAVLHLFSAYTGGGKRDRRYKTGYKNNDTPTYVPLGSRAKLSGIAATIGGLILWPKIVLGLAAAFVACYFLFPPVEKRVAELLQSWREQ